MSEIHRIKCGNGNCYIVENGTDGVLVDTGKKEFVNQIIEKCKVYHVKLILLTHAHFDHAENAALLLCFLIFVISYIQSYFPPERSKRILGRFHGIGANIISALLGTVTPFCSCSSIPLFIGFTSAGLPLGVTFSFLISSPMVDLGSLIRR